MKKTLLTTIALCLAATLFARSISVNEASHKAGSFFNESSTTRSAGGGLSLVWTGPTATRSSFSPMYVFNHDGGGWVVIAGDDRVRPVLAFSRTGRFVTDGMPANISSWFGLLSDAIVRLNGSDEPRQAAVALEWAALESSGGSEYTVIKQLETAQWDQGYNYSPTYNKNCPTSGGDRYCITGCVQTSTAIVMRYHKWPLTGTGKTIPSYSSSTTDQTTIGPVTLDHTYDWNNMPLECDDNTDYKGISLLMFELGVMNQATYGLDATSANFNYDAFVNYFDYDPSLTNYSKDGFTDEQWCGMLRYNIDNVGPVPYAGAHGTSGHQFVIDGYAGGDYFCVNWGWSGTDNGVYSINALSGTGFDYSDYQNGYFNMMPRKESGSLSSNTTGLFFTRMRNNNTQGLKMTGGSFSNGGLLYYSAGVITNYTKENPANWYLLIKHIDSEGYTVGDYGSNKQSPIAPGSGVSIPSDSFTISSDVKLGDRIVGFYSSSDTGPWERIRTLPGEPVSDEIAAFDYPVIEAESSGYKSGELFYYRIANTNRNYTVKWYFDSVERSMAEILVKGDGAETLTPGEHIIKAKLTFDDGQTRTLIRKITVGE